MRVPDWFGSRRIGRRVGVLLLSLTVVTAVLVFGRTPLANAARTAFGFAAPPAPPPAPPPPVIASFTPSSGPVTTIVSISGSGFTGATQVRFGSLTSPAIELVDDATLLATVPVGGNTSNITVVTPMGSTTSGTAFTVVAGSAWINPSGGSFFTASNWSNNQVPTSTNDILITLPGFYTVTGPTGGGFRSLVLGAIGGSSNNQSLDINSTLSFTNNVDVKHGGQFNLNGGTLSVNGLNVASTFNWNTGNISVSTGGATVFAGGILNINGVGTKNLGGRLTNQGTLNWLGATTINATTGTQIINAATGTTSIQNSASLTGPGTLVNQGNFQKLTGTGTSSFASWTLQNSGTFFIPGDGDVSLASVTFSAPGTLETELGAVNTTKITTGSASITGGTLQLDNSPNRNVGDTFTIIASTSGSGNFSAFSGLSAGPGRIFQPTPSFPTAYRVVVVNAPPPTIGSFTPTSGIAGSSVTITGTNFFSVSRVTINNVPATFSVDSDTQLRCIVPPTATSGQIRVTTATGNATSSGTFTILPVITTFSPSSGSPTQQVRIFGSGFGGATAVRFGGTVATFTIDSPNQLTAIVPFGASTGSIRVTAGGNSFDSTSNFTVVPASGGTPSITNASPRCATVGQGIIISGTNFLGVTQVTFNGRQSEFSVLDNTRIDAVFPGAAPGAVMISVISPNGTANFNGFFNGSDGNFSFLGPDTAPVPAVQARTGSEFAVAYVDGNRAFVGSINSIIPWNPSTAFGTVTAFVYDPVRADTIFAGVATPPGARPGRNSAAAPVVFRSDNNGLSWTQADFNLPDQVLIVSTIIAFPGPTSGTTTVLIGTNAGIFRSDDRGATWTDFNTGLTPQQIDSLAYSPGSGGFLYAGLSGGQVYTRAIGSPTWNLSSNGLPGSSASNFFVAADPGNGQVAYVAVSDFQNGIFAVYKTTDRAANWLPFSNGLPAQPLSSLVISPAGNVLFVNVNGILYRSFDGAGNWSPVGSNLPAIPFTPVSFISVDGSQLLVGTRLGVFISKDSGNIWSPLNRGFGSPTISQIEVGGNNRVYAQDVSGVIYRSIRDGASFNFALDAFEQSIFLRTAPSDGGIIYAGGFFLESNKLVKSLDGGASWFTLPSGGLGMRDVAVHPTIPDTVLLLRSTGLTRSTDGGTSFQSFGSGLPSSARIVRYAKANANILYASGNGLDGVYRSTDGGATWSPANSGLPVGSTFLITSLVPSPLDTTGSVCLAGTNDARIFRTTNGGTSWTEVSSLPLTGYSQSDTTDFVFFNSSTIYASYYFQSTVPNTPPEGYIQVSTDGGATWSEFSPGSSIGGINDLAMETGGSGVLYAGTILGTFAYNTTSMCPVPPVVTNFSPGSGLAGSTVTITGFGFTGATDVSIAGFTSPGFTVMSDTQIMAEVPNAPGNSGLVCVTTPFGTGCGAESYTINVAPPTITAFTPNTGSTGTTVTLTGTSFTGATSVTFNGTNAPGYTVVNDTTITVTVPSGATTGPISVTTPAGTGTSAANFTVLITYNWINPSGGDFGTASNWSSGFVPGTADVAIIDLPGTYTITSGSRTLGGLTLGGVSGLQTFILNGNLALNGPAVINPNGFFNFGDGTLSGAGTVTVGGQMSFIGTLATYAAGTLTIQSGGIVTKNTSNNTAINSPVNNSGTFITPNTLNVNAAFNNLNGSVFEARGDGGFAGGGPFNIAVGATFRKTLGTSNFTPSTPFNNDGTLECQNGFIDLQGGGAGAGEFRSSAGASIIFRADYTFNNGAQLTGAGTSFLPGNVTLNGNVTMRNASIGGLGNTIGGPGNLIIPNGGTTTITGGGATFAGTGTIEVQSGGTFNLNGIGHTFNRTVNNAGLITWSQLDISIGTGAAINNLAGGFFRVQHSDRFINGSGSFSNAGTFEQPSGANVTVNVPFTNSGIINVPAVGTMTISNLVQTSTGAINTQLGGTVPATNHSQLRTTNFTAAGTFSAAYINGFTASPGQSFDVITIAGSRLGTFSSVNLPPTGPGQAFLNGFKTNSFTLNLVGTPSIASFTPTSGIVGTSVTLTGSNFTGATSVTFNGTSATGFTVINDTTITVNVPTGATTGTISVTNPAGTGTSAANFTVFQTPTVTSFTPTSGAAGTSVTITGTNFTGTTAVRFNGTNAPGFTVVNDTTITVNVPTGATTGTISVTNPAGTGTSAGTFTVFQTPTVTSFTPTSGTFGTSVTITGTNFNGTTAVTFNGTTAPGFTVVNPTTITVSVPTGASTGPIAVTNPAGTGTSSANFNVILTFNWINPAGGDFNIGANWSSGVVPGPTDFAVIDLPGTYSVTVTNVATTLGGLTLGGVSGTQTLVISNTFGGGFNLNGTGTVNPNGRITFNAGTLGGTGSLNLTAGSTMTLESAFGKAVTGTLNNAGTIAFVSGSSDLTVNGTLNNQSGGLFDIPTDNTITVGGALNNLAGATLRKSAGTGPSFITTTGAGTFDNFGTLLCQSGQLRPNSVRIQNGSTFTANGSGLLLLNSTSGTTTFAAGSPTFTSNGATIDGDLAGTGSFTGTLKFNAGTITGTLNVTSGSTLTVLNTTFGKAVSGTLNNSGTVNYFAPSFDLNINPGGTFNNLSGGLFDLNTDNGLVINTSAAFNNQAGSTFRKSGGTGTSVVANSGTFTNAGAIVAPVTGFLQINGLFTQTGTGVINTTLNGTTAGTNYSQLQLQSPTLGGTLNVALQVGFTPAAGNTFDVVTFSGPRTGGFASVNLPPPANGRSFSGAFTGTSGAAFRVTTAASFDWINPAGGDFATPSNWSGNAVPGAGDTAVFNLTNTFTVTGTGTVAAINIGNGAVGFNGTITTTALNVSGGAFTLAGGTFTLNGAGTISGANVFAFNGGTLGGTGTLTLTGSGTFNAGTIASGTTFNIGSTATLTLATNGVKLLVGTMNNAGTVNFPGNGFQINPGTFNNQSGGVFDLQANNSLSLTAGATFNNQAGALLKKSGGTGLSNLFGNVVNNGTIRSEIGTMRSLALTVGDGSTYTQAGGLISLETLTTLASDATFSTNGARINGQILGGPGTLATGSTLEYFGGVLNDNVTLNISAGALLLITGGVNKDIHGTINNAGTAIYSGTALRFTPGTPSVFNNQTGATFDIQGDGGIQTTGGGSFNNAGAFGKSVGTNVSAIDVPFTNSGLLATPFAGGAFLQFNGSFNQTSAGTTAFAIGGTTPGNGFSQLQFGSGSAPSFAGTASVVLANGFTPTAGQTFDVITFTSRTGSFGTVNLPPNGGGISYSSGFQPASFQVMVNSTFPSITSFTPTSGPVGTSVTITGTNFTGTTAVTFNGTSATTFTVVNDTTITATVPTGATTGTISVTNGSGTGTSATSFTVIQPPTVTSFTPTSGPVGTSVTITGTNFTGASSVAFNGTSATTFTVVNDTTITATVPTGATTGPISVTTVAGTGTSSGSFTVIQPPTVTSFTPTSGPVGTSVTITGTNFTGASSVAFNGTSATTFTVNSDTQITATVPTGATTGTISVTTVAGTGTSSGNFTVIQPPTVTSFTPTSGPVGTSVTITGTNFTGASSVAFNGTSATSFTVVNATTITATVPTGATTGTISVTTVAGTGTSSGSFTVIQPPTVTSFTPTSGGISTPVTITGANFTGATTVTFNGASATFSVVNDTTITTTVPVSATTGPISVTTLAGTGTSSASFTVLPLPLVLSFSPTSGGIGTAVTITGANFTGANTVRFNGTVATTFTVVNDTTITTNVPAGATTGPISVSTIAGTGTNVANFTVITGFDWINPLGGSFNDPSNWSGGIVPGPMDTASFNLAAGYTVTGTGSVAAISITNGNVTFNGTFSAGTLSESGLNGVTNLGTLSLGSALIDGLFTNDGGTLDLGGTFTLNGRLNMPGGTVQGTGDLLINGTFDWQGGTVTGSGTLIANGIAGVGGATININGSANHALFRNLVSSPTPGITAAVVDGTANLTFGTGVSITNNGEFFADTEKAYPFNLTFNNLNRINKIPGTGTVEFQGPFNNAGLVAVHNGELLFSGGGTFISGGVGVQYSALANGRITFAAGNYNFGPGVIGGGQPGGLVVITGTTAITLGGDFAIGDPTQVDPGTSIAGLGSLIITDTGTLDWRGGTIGGGSGDGNLVVNNGGQLLLNDTDDKQLRRTLLNDGLILWNDGNIRGDTSAFPPTIFNRSTGIFRVQNDGDAITFIGTFNNQGIFEKPTGSGTNHISWDFQNQGILRVPSTTGILFINQFTQTSAGFLEVTVGGTNEGVNLSQLQTIDAALDGTLNISLAPGFTPTQGQSFPFMTFDTGILRPAGVKSGKTGPKPKVSSGDFSVINGTNLGGGLSFRPVNAFSAYTLKTVGAPVITSFSPSSGLAGTSVLITGLDFDGATSVQFNGTEVSGFNISPLGNQITTTVPAGATTGPITVTTPLGTGTSATNFVVNVAPTITSFTPTSGPVGTIVTITGTNFTGATNVTFNGTTATGFTVDSDTQITAAVPTGANTGPISVTTPNGTATSSASFMVTILPPVITSFSPASGPAGTVVTINGNNFNGVTSVQFNGVEATFSVNPLVGFTGPAEPIGGGYNTGGTPTTKGSRVNTSGQPTVKNSRITPESEPVAKGSRVNPASEPIVKGTPRNNGKGAGVPNVNAPIPKVATAITATVPAGATTGFITVTGPGGTATSPTQFIVLFPPTVTAFTPTQGQPGDNVVITGTNFTGATSVTFGGTPATSFTVNSATQITAVVPTGAISGKISVTTPDGTGTSAADFIVCGYSVAPTSFIVLSAGGDQSVTISTFPRIGSLTKGGPRNASLCPWTAVSNSPFITILTGATGVGNGTVTFRVAAFAGSGTRVGTITVAGQTITITQQPSFVAGDFNGDLKSDLLWRNIATGATSIWLMNGTNFSQNLPLASSETCWFVGGVNDFTGDGQVDILWRNQTITGANGLWRFSGTTVVEGLTVTPDQPNLAWVMNCTGDFNGDGRPDIVLRNSLTSAAEVWLMNGVNRTSVVPLTIAGLTSAEQFVGSGDFNGDGKADLLVRNQSAGTLRVITLNGTTPTGTLTIPTLNSNWELSAVGDFNADGQPDLVWRNLTDGSNVIWLMNGTSLIQSLPFLSVTDPNWRIVGPK